MKNLILLLVASVLCITGYAQSSNVSNSINKIKRDSKTYFYAESTSASEAEAKEAATVMLQSLVSDHNKQSGCSVDFNSLDIQYLQMMRGEYHRVFAYARRDGAKTESIKVDAPTQTQQVETPAPTHVATTPTATPTPTPIPQNRVINYLEYEVNGEEVTIIGSDRDIHGEDIIPSTIEGYPVPAIGKDAFEHSAKLTGVTIPDSV